MSRHKRHVLLQSHYDADVCPMAGKRAPELAAGYCDRVFDELCGQALTEILLEAPLPLEPDLQLQLVSDFSSAQSHIKLLLQTAVELPGVLSCKWRSLQIWIYTIG